MQSGLQTIIASDAAWLPTLTQADYGFRPGHDYEQSEDIPLHTGRSWLWDRTVRSTDAVYCFDHTTAGVAIQRGDEEVVEQERHSLLDSPACLSRSVVHNDRMTMERIYSVHCVRRLQSANTNARSRTFDELKYRGVLVAGTCRHHGLLQIRGIGHLCGPWTTPEGYPHAAWMCLDKSSRDDEVMRHPCLHSRQCSVDGRPRIGARLTHATSRGSVRGC